MGQSENNSSQNCDLTETMGHWTGILSYKHIFVHASVPMQILDVRKGRRGRECHFASFGKEIVYALHALQNRAIALCADQ